MKRLIIALVLISLTSTAANAATKKPSPTPTAKGTSKVTTKATPKVTAKASAKVTPKATSKSTAKPTMKTSVKTTKKPVVKKTYKPKPRKSVKVTPSPTPAWPPKGYIQNGDIYAKIPTSKELIGLASSNSKLAAQLTTCETNACGAILAASQAGCNWWEFNADVIGPTSDTDNTIIKLGSLTSLFGSSKPKQILPYLLISQEEIKNGLKVSNIQIACHREPIPTDLKVPSTSYQKNS